MNRLLRKPLRTILPSALLAVGLVAALALPAAAGYDDLGADERPTRTVQPIRRLASDALDRAMDVPDIEAVVNLDCAPRHTDNGAAVTCEWRAGDDLGVRAWQLWKLQVRPERGDRTLVAELGADAMSHTDVDVTVPAAYLYAVLGLDADGEVIARSRVEPVKLHERDHEVEPMRLQCAAQGTTSEPSDATRGIVVGCGWSEVSNDAAVGYVLWKGIDGAERTAIARVGLETTHVRDEAVAPGHRYTYVVTAVDGAGEVVGRSRPETVGIPAHDRAVDRETDRVTDRPVDRATDRPVDRVTDRPVDHVTDHATDRQTDVAERDHRPVRD